MSSFFWLSILFISWVAYILIEFQSDYTQTKIGVLGKKTFYTRIFLVCATVVASFFFSKQRLTDQLGVGIKKVEINYTEDGCETYSITDNDSMGIIVIPTCK